MRIHHIGLLLAMVSAGCGREQVPAPLTPPASPTPTARSRAILLVSIDTLRADRLGCYGHLGALTPHIDRLSRLAASFTDVTAPAPVTAPSHATILTGLHPPEHGVRANGAFRLGASTTTLSEALQSKGFVTAAVVGGFPLSPASGLDQGFERYDARFSSGAEGDGALERPASEVVDAALALLPELFGRPYFLFVHFYDPHHPYEPPQDLASAVADAYDGEVASVDRELVRLLRRVQASAAPPDVMILSDHGESLGDHGEATHSVFAYQSTLQVPLLLHRRALAHPRYVADPVMLADVTPTLLELAGASPLSTAGRSLAGAAPLGPRPIYFESLLPELELGWARLTGLRQGVLKLVVAPRPELYRLDQDPGEARDVFASEPAVGARLQSDLAQLERARWPSGGLAQASPVTPEDREKLEALGYIGGGGGGGGGESLALPSGADPKDRVEVLRLMESSLQLSRSGRAAEAEADVRAALDLDPTNTALRKQLGVLLVRQGKLVEADEELGRAATGARGSLKADILERKARAALSRGDAETALADARAALAAHPGQERAKATLLRAEARLAQGEDAGPALARLDQALGAAPQDGALHHERGVLLLRVGRPQEAVTALDRARALLPGDGEVARHAAEAHAGAGDPAAAAAILRERLARDPDEWESEYALAVLQSRTGQGAEAIAVLRRLSEAHPEAAFVWNALGTALGRSGDASAAVDCFRRAVAANPSHDGYKQNLAHALARTGRKGG